MQPQPQPVQPWPAQNTQNQSVRDWQEQMTAEQLAASQTGHQSRIFGRKEERKPAAPEKSFVSRIFGLGKKEEYDGLSDGTTLQDMEAARRAAEAAKPARRTATGAEIARPQTRWKQEEPETEEPSANRDAARRRRDQTSEQTAMEIPAEKPAVHTESPRTEPARPETVRPVKDPVRDDSGYRRPVPEEKKTPERPAAKTVIPVVEPIGEQAYQPDLKLPPKKKTEEEDEGPWMPTPYNFPPITDLAKPQQGVEDTREEDIMRSRKLEETLASFRVQARVVHVTHGPAISRFELELEAGTKVNKVSELEKDIAYGMSATSVRIEAPIPGKRLVGVEVPNRKVTTVTLREVMESEQMQSAKSILTVALGKDIAGTPIVCDLAKMPHMLIAGQTGSGKSVCINAIINSLLYRASPDEVRLILVDPKVVELQCYNGIPHLLIPVVNDPRKAAGDRCCPWCWRCPGR